MSDQKKPVFDEQTLAKLLEAAYVLQEHNRERRKSEPEREATSKAPEQAASPVSRSAPVLPNGATALATPQPDYQAVLAKVVETQQRIQAGHLSRHSSLTLLVEEALDSAHGSGAAIALLDGEFMHYEAVAGISMMPGGAVIPVEDAMCAICVRTGEAFRCAQINPEILPDIEGCRGAGVQAFVAVPIFVEDKVAGALELYYGQPQAFSEQDVHACQLFASLVAEVPAPHGQKAQTSAAASGVGRLQAGGTAEAHGGPRNASTYAGQAYLSNAALCRRCGHELLDHEQFCVECGSPRTGTNEVPRDKTDLRTERATREQQEAETQSPDALAETKHDLAWVQALKGQIPELFAEIEVPPRAGLESSELETSEPRISIIEKQPQETEVDENTVVVEEAPAAESRALAKPPVAADWSSAASAREFLEQLAGTQRRSAVARLWNERRGDIYLAIAVALIACVIRWGIWSSPSVNATAAPPNANATRHNSPDSDLSAFDRLLISLGLAEAPEPAIDKGNPATQVWVDLHSALYYCPGADMYGKTPHGKYATQREAQLDSFEPAYRKVCQ